jgi:hypothetical protein
MVVNDLIVELLEKNQSTKNYGPKKNMSGLCMHKIAKELILSKNQIQNKSAYNCKSKFNFNNLTEPLQAKDRLSVFHGDEAEDKAFVFGYDVNDSDR